MNIPIPDTQDLQAMGCPKSNSVEVIQRLEQTPAIERVTLDQIQSVIQEVTNAN